MDVLRCYAEASTAPDENSTQPLTLSRLTEPTHDPRPRRNVQHRLNRRPARWSELSMPALGVFGEVFVGNFYYHFFHNALWLWRVFPIYKGYTSLYAPFLWGIYGFQLYLFHDNLAKRNIRSDNEIATIFGVETIVLEILLNLSFLVIFGHYIFYYSTNDLWHFTSVQTFPFFFIASLIYTKAIRREKNHKVMFTILNVALCFVIVAIE